MKNRLKKYWNFKPLGLFKALFYTIHVSLISFWEFLNSCLWKFNLGSCEKNVTIQINVSINFPSNLTIKRNVNIGRNVIISSEFENSKLYIGKDSQINRNVELDYSGGIQIGDNVVISEGSTIMSHSHGYNPKSVPIKIFKKINNNVWVGAKSVILPNVKEIGENSIVAAGSVVTKDVPRDVVVAGNPAKIIKNIV